MIIERTMKNGCVNIQYNLNEKEKEILEILREDNCKGFIEFRGKYNPDMSKRFDSTQKVTEEEIQDLYKNGFIKDVEDAWHPTYTLDNLGIFYLLHTKKES